MEIKINAQNLVDSPYSEEKKSAFLFDDDDFIDQIVQELVNAHPSVFLISGYRGVGKTSFVNRIARQLKSNHICATLNVAKYDSYEKLIKRLIRELFLSFDTSYKHDQNHEKLYNEFALLYDRTFHDISNSNTLNHKAEKKLEKTLKINFKKLITPVIFTLLGIANLAYEFIPSKIFGIVLTLAAAIWTALTTWDISVSRITTDTGSTEYSKKSLYDDEIAENRLLEIIASLKKNDYKILIVFDELDKHETTEELMHIIDDLKPLLLSGSANFFIIAGQQLSYYYEEATLQDNQVISSIFSKIIHIPFLKHATLKAYCINLLKDHKDKRNDLILDYLDTLILNSSRVPRKLVNLIRSKIRWHENKAYLILEEQNARENHANAQVLDCLCYVTDNALPKIAKSEAQLDFFIAQIHRWILKMKEYGSIHFLMSEIIDIKSYEHGAPKHYISQLPNLKDLLIDELLERKLISMKHQDEPESESYVFWIQASDQSQTNTDKNNSEKDQESTIVSSGDFITEYANLENTIRNICIEQGSEEIATKTSLPQNLIFLQRIGAIQLKSETYINDVINVRNQIVHGEVSGKEALALARQSLFILNRLKADIIQEYIFFISRKFLQQFKFHSNNEDGFDFVAIQNQYTIGFDVKFISRDLINQAFIANAIRNFDNFKKVTTHMANYTLFCIIPKRHIDNKLIKLTQNTIKKDFPHLANDVSIAYIPENPKIGLIKIIQDYLEIYKQIDINQVAKDFKFFSEEELKLIPAIIEQEAKKEWPSQNDFDMLLNYSDQEEESVQYLRKLANLDLTEWEFDTIVNKAKQDWPRDFTMQKKTLIMQMEAVQKLRRLKSKPIPDSVFETIKTYSEVKHPRDFKMRLNEIEAQKQAYIVLQTLGSKNVSKQALQKLKDTAHQEFPDDYHMQYLSLSKQLENYTSS